MKASVSISIVFLLISCSERQYKKTETVKTNYFDSVQQQNIKLLHGFNLTQFDDTAKWLMYTMQGNDSSKFGRARDRIILPKVPLGFLKLNLSYVKVENDTLYLLYNFLFNDSIPVEQSTILKPIVNGVKFNTKNSSVIGYIVGEAVYSQTGNPQNRYKNPLQPEVIEFIKKNKNRLNPWFKQEAIRRKIIQ